MAMPKEEVPGLNKFEEEQVRLHKRFSRATSRATQMLQAGIEPTTLESILSDLTPEDVHCLIQALRLRLSLSSVTFHRIVHKHLTQMLFDNMDPDDDNN